jgi:TetR/AcrR family transcriptional repressor of nem operon
VARNGAQTRERILDAAEHIVLDRGLAATSIDDVLSAAEVSKGAFFHHFPSKNRLARALVERYATADVAFLEEVMTRAEETSADPAEQILAFLRWFEEAADGLVEQQPSCLYVSYMFDRQLFDDGTNDVIAETVVVWRRRIADKLRAAAELHPPIGPFDPDALADHVFATFEGAFLMTRAIGDPSLMRRQLAVVREHLALLFGIAQA